MLTVIQGKNVLSPFIEANDLKIVFPSILEHQMVLEIAPFLHKLHFPLLVKAVPHLVLNWYGDFFLAYQSKKFRILCYHICHNTCHLLRRSHELEILGDCTHIKVWFLQVTVYILNGLFYRFFDLLDNYLMVCWLLKAINFVLGWTWPFLDVS